MSKYKARKTLQIGNKLYEPGSIIESDDAPEVIGSWVYWGDVEVVEDAPVHKSVHKTTPAKKAAVKKSAAKKEH